MTLIYKRRGVSVICNQLDRCREGEVIACILTHLVRALVTNGGVPKDDSAFQVVVERETRGY